MDGSPWKKTEKWLRVRFCRFGQVCVEMETEMEMDITTHSSRKSTTPPCYLNRVASGLCHRATCVKVRDDTALSSSMTNTLLDC